MMPHGGCHEDRENNANRLVIDGTWVQIGPKGRSQRKNRVAKREMFRVGDIIIGAGNGIGGGEPPRTRTALSPCSSIPCMDGNLFFGKLHGENHESIHQQMPKFPRNA
jgi:hypothetical protein